MTMQKKLKTNSLFYAEIVICMLRIIMCITSQTIEKNLIHFVRHLILLVFVDVGLLKLLMVFAHAFTFALFTLLLRCTAYGGPAFPIILLSSQTFEEHIKLLKFASSPAFR